MIVLHSASLWSRTTILTHIRGCTQPRQRSNPKVTEAFLHPQLLLLHLAISSGCTLKIYPSMAALCQAVGKALLRRGNPIRVQRRSRRLRIELGVRAQNNAVVLTCVGTSGLIHFCTRKSRGAVSHELHKSPSCTAEGPGRCGCALLCSSARSVRLL
jgi:hypothetical protein